ncbi:MAG: hypothetical protein QG555_530 [Thermodesulfobacteriota bacterium]|nr:hypothetical protein [Thermodesulfobacteriota bacterium]
MPNLFSAMASPATFPGTAVAIPVQEHIARRPAGGSLPVIYGRNLPRFGGMDEHESAAADITGPGECHGHDKSRRHGGVNGVAAPPQDLKSGP